MENVTKEATGQDEVFFKGRKWFIPQYSFIVISIGKKYSLEELAKLRKKINMWSQRRDRYAVDITISSTTYGPEILILNETLLEKRDKRKLEKALHAPKEGGPE